MSKVMVFKSTAQSEEAEWLVRDGAVTVDWNGSIGVTAREYPSVFSHADIHTNPQFKFKELRNE